MFFSMDGESEEASMGCLVNVTKDRAKGPQGRRLPQRKSMMPTTHSAEEDDQSSSPHTNGTVEENTSSKANSESKWWISLSIEEMYREKGEDVDGQRSSSTSDIVEQATGDTNNGDIPKLRRMGLKLLGQHTALMRELEMKFKAGMVPGARRSPFTVKDEDDEEKQDDKDAKSDKNIELLSSKLELTKVTLDNLEDKVNDLTNLVEATTKKSEQAKDGFTCFYVLGHSTFYDLPSYQKEAERINEECKQALAEATRARSESQLLVKECKETLEKLNSEKNSR